MIMSNLTLHHEERYGGIDLKKHYKGYWAGGLGISILLHLLVIMLYLGWSWFKPETEKATNGPDRTTVDFTREVSTATEESLSQSTSAPRAPEALIRHSIAGIPVPVPNAIETPNSEYPIQSESTVGSPFGKDTSNRNTGNIGSRIANAKREPDEGAGSDFYVPVDKEPTPIRNLQSMVTYPELAVRSQIEGKVSLRLRIGKDGHVEKIIVDRSSGYEILDNAAIESLKNARFTPALQGHEPVTVWYEAPIEFRLR